VRHRVALDTNVLVAALRSDRGASRQLLLGALERSYQLVASVPLMIEYEAVLSRAEHVLAAGLSAEEVQTLLDAVAMVADPVRLAYLWRPLLTDTEDDMVLETAINGRAEILVTLNLRDFAAAKGMFDVLILSPADALEWLRKRP
jgi:putative PIN family toxin of toxin-antitoxin system